MKYQKKHGYHINIDVEIMNLLNVDRVQRILSGEHDCSISRIIDEILQEHYKVL